MKSQPLDAFIAERWDDTVAFVGAFRDLEERAAEMFENEAGGRIREWFGDQGYELQINAGYAEYRAYRSAWLTAEGDPAAILAIGGLLPAGMMKVDSLHPYAWIYLKREKGANDVRVRRAAHLRASVPTASEWLHPETKHAQPLGRYLSDIENLERLRFMRDPVALADFVIQRAPDLLVFDRQVSEALNIH